MFYETTKSKYGYTVTVKQFIGNGPQGQYAYTRQESLEVVCRFSASSIQECESWIRLHKAGMIA